VTITWLTLHESEVALLPFHRSGASSEVAGVMQSAPVEISPCQTFTRRLPGTM
jgi:hypothetical protein